MNKIYLPDEIYGIIYSYCNTLDKIKLMGVLNNDLHLLEHLKNIKRAKQKLKQLRGLNKKVKNQRKQIKQLQYNHKIKRKYQKEIDINEKQIRTLKHDIFVTRDLYRRIFVKNFELIAEIDRIKKDFILIKKDDYPFFLNKSSINPV